MVQHNIIRYCRELLLSSFTPRNQTDSDRCEMLLRIDSLRGKQGLPAAVFARCGAGSRCWDLLCGLVPVIIYSLIQSLIRA